MAVENLTRKTIKKRYIVKKLLGRGGMAEVYLVQDKERGVPLAMKVLREDLAEDVVFIRRFKREAKTLAKLQHPNIVRFYGLGQEGPLAFLLMEYIDGITLRREIFNRKRPFSQKRMTEIMEPICAALHYAHQQGLVHCDVKSANIMIDRLGKVVLTDFGIARRTETATATMVGAGAPAYMAPEQIRGEDPTPQTDIYALGVILFELLSGGMRPFIGESAETTGSTAQKITWEHLHTDAPSLKQYNKNISSGLDGIVQKCLRKKPVGRFESAAALLEAFQSPGDFEDENRIAPLSLESKHPLGEVKTDDVPSSQPSSVSKSNNYALALKRILALSLIFFGIYLIFATDLSEKIGLVSSTVTPTPWPTATRKPFTPTPKCSLTSRHKPSWSNLVCEEFSSTHTEDFYTGSESSDLANTNVSIKNGKYVIDITGIAYSGYKGGVVHRFEVGRSKDFILSVDAEINSVYKHCGLGIAFRGSSDNYLFFQVQHDGYYTFQRLINNDWSSLIGWRPHGGVKWDEAFNITVIAEGDRFDFYLDGEHVNSYSDNSLNYSEEIYLVATASEGASAVIKFDNLIIKRP